MIIDIKPTIGLFLKEDWTKINKKYSKYIINIKLLILNKNKNIEIKNTHEKRRGNQ